VTLTHTINIDPNSEEVEEFEVDNNNLADISVAVKGDQSPPKGAGYRVTLSLSANAMIGLGTMLIRKGLSAKGDGASEFDYEPLTPITDNTIVYNEMGIHLVPGSADLMIFLEDFGNISEVIAKARLY
jgi:hypothetical protein